MKITLDLDQFIDHMRFLRDHKSVDGETVRLCTLGTDAKEEEV